MLLRDVKYRGNLKGCIQSKTSFVSLRGALVTKQSLCVVRQQKGCIQGKMEKLLHCARKDECCFFRAQSNPYFTPLLYAWDVENQV